MTNGPIYTTENGSLQASVNYSNAAYSVKPRYTKEWQYTISVDIIATYAYYVIAIFREAMQVLLQLTTLSFYPDPQ